MKSVFYLSAAVAIISTFMVITRRNAVHALLYLIVSFLAAAMIFFVLGAPFVAALEVIIYAGAIMVLFVFVIMILNLGPQEQKKQGPTNRAKTWLGPGILAFVLLAELVYVVVQGPSRPVAPAEVSPKAVGIVLMGPYVVGVELASILLLAGLVGAYHVGRRIRPRSAHKGEDA
jgi:NADH-quinone oxidoreductase subunit J